MTSFIMNSNYKPTKFGVYSKDTEMLTMCSDYGSVVLITPVAAVW